MRKAGGWLLIATGFVLCPCHFPLTLGVLAGVFGGTAIGSAFFSRHSGLIYAVAAGYFVLALAAGWYLLSRRATACPPGQPAKGEALSVATGSRTGPGGAP